MHEKMLNTQNNLPSIPTEKKLNPMFLWNLKKILFYMLSSCKSLF